MRYETSDGKVYTDEDINRWCEAYERGEFPEGEEATGVVVSGRPPQANAQTTTITCKVPVGMKVALKKKAEQQGMTTSAYIRSALLNATL